MSRNTKVQNQLRDQFIDFTQTTTNIATQFLRATNWDLELAINDYLTHGRGPSNSHSQSLVSIFDTYKDDNDKIDIDGTIRYIEDLGYDPENKVTLALAEFLESPSMGVFNRRPFLLKWSSVRANSLNDMKKYVKDMELKLGNDVEFLKKVYRFAFTFLLEDGQKALPLESACDYWRLLLGELYGDKIDFWIEFLQTEWKQAISRDTWNMFFVFLQDWNSDPKLEKYDDTAAWPSLIDEFVESFHQKIAS